MKNRALFPGQQTFHAILSGAYTPLDLREFVQLCRDLALPIIRKKIALGKLNLSATGLKEIDVVYDCIADLFHRDENGSFVQIRTYFDNQLGDAEKCSEEAMVATLRRLIFGKINNNIIRLYSEADPTLGKILRNVKLALERSDIFEEVTRFGDVFLVPRGIPPLFHLPPIQMDFVRRSFSSVVLVHDTIPVMLKKLHAAMIEQEEFQRAVSLVSAALLFREIYNLGWETQTEPNTVEEKIETDRLAGIVENVCRGLETDMYSTYVEKGKCSQVLFGHYMEAVKSILHGSLLDEHLDGSTFCEYLQLQMPELTKDDYRRDHRKILEYLAKVGKDRLRNEIKTS